MLSRATFVAAAAVAAAAVAVLAVPGMAVAAPMACSARTDVVTKLASKYHEQPSSAALTNDGQLLEVLKSKDGTTWSIIITTPKGVSCLVAAGGSWQDKFDDQVSPQL